MYYKRLYLLVSLISLVSIAGCSFKNDVSNDYKDMRLKIGYQSEESFTKRYSNNVITQQFPNLDYTVVSLYNMFDEGSDINQVAANTDILFVPTEKMSEFIHAGLLMNLDPLLSKSNINTSDFHPEIMEYTRNLGEGSLYGIPTSVRGQVLAYNKDIFDQYFVDYPYDGMTWEDVITLAQLFPSNGLVISSILPTEIIFEIGKTRGLQAYNADFETIHMASEHWEKVWTEVVVPLKNQMIVRDKNIFINNNAAMMVVNDNNFQWIEDSSNYEVVTMPIDFHHPTQSNYTYIDGFYALSVHTPYKNESFDLLQFFLSPQLSQFEKATRHHTVSIYKNDPLLKTERALVGLVPASNERTDVPFEFYEVGEALIEQIINDNLSIKDALAQMQLQLELLMNEKEK